MRPPPEFPDSDSVNCAPPRCSSGSGSGCCPLVLPPHPPSGRAPPLALRGTSYRRLELQGGTRLSGAAGDFGGRTPCRGAVSARRSEDYPGRRGPAPAALAPRPPPAATTGASRLRCRGRLRPQSSAPLGDHGCICAFFQCFIACPFHDMCRFVCTCSCQCATAAYTQRCTCVWNHCDKQLLVLCSFGALCVCVSLSLSGFVRATRLVDVPRCACRQRGGPQPVSARPGSSTRARAATTTCRASGAPGSPRRRPSGSARTGLLSFRGEQGVAVTRGFAMSSDLPRGISTLSSSGLCQTVVFVCNFAPIPFLMTRRVPQETRDRDSDPRSRCLGEPRPPSHFLPRLRPDGGSPSHLSRAPWKQRATPTHQQTKRRTSALGQSS